MERKGAILLPLKPNLRRVINGLALAWSAEEQVHRIVTCTWARQRGHERGAESQVLPEPTIHVHFPCKCNGMASTRSPPATLQQLQVSQICSLPKSAENHSANGHKEKSCNCPVKFTISSRTQRTQHQANYAGIPVSRRCTGMQISTNFTHMSYATILDT